MDAPLIPFQSYIDRFTVFDGAVSLAGWVFSPGRTIVLVALVIGDEPPVDVRHGLPSDDVVAAYGEDAAGSRFRLRATSGEADANIIRSSLRVRFADGAEITLRNLGERNKGDEPVHRMFPDFLRMIADEPAGRLLEVGARARSGNVRKALIPTTWEYVGFDIVAGPNVDVVGDAHRLSAVFEHGSFDAVMAISVFEHLFMPWKFAIELNRIMRGGGLAYFLTHQTYGLHDAPWDFWRFSADAWPAIFNRRTGFEIVAAALGEPAFIVPHVSGPNYDPYTPGYLAAAVIVRKTSETELVWDVDIEEVISTVYPGYASAQPVA